jgi:signal transduction histidine kinase
LLQALATQVLAALDRVALFESVEKEQRRLLAVLRSAADAILVMDAHNCLTLANPAGECLFPDLDAQVGRPLPQDQGYGELLHLLDQVRAAGEHRQADVAWPDGRTFSALVTPIEEGGQVVVLHDISQFIALAALKNEYIATATHDLKNPLMAVLGYNDLMAKAGPLTEMQQEFSKRIQNSAMLMRELVLNLLEISRLESGAPMQAEMLDLHTLLNECADLTREQAALKNQRLIVSLCPEAPVIRGDRQLLQQLVSNLLGNAVKYTPADRDICLNSATEDGQVIVKFQDHGIGISEEDLPHIFNKFYRVHNDDTVDIEGTGLGLAIVKSIVESHHGQIAVESQRGVGTTFTVRLPLVQNDKSN